MVSKLDIETITKDLKSVTDFINDGVEGKVPSLTEEEAAEFQAKALKVFNEASSDLIVAKTAKVAGMDILKMNIHFFDNIPSIWRIYQDAAEITVKTEV